MQLYATKATIEALDVTTMDVYIEGYDESQIVSEVGAVNLLDAMDFADIADYYATHYNDEEDI